MKIARTFTIDHKLVVELQKKKNQSLVVNKALIAYFHEEHFIELQEVPSKQMMAALLERDDVPEALKYYLRYQIRLTTTKESSS